MYGRQAGSRHAAGTSYTVLYSDSLPAGLSVWQIAEENVPAGVPGLLEWTDRGDIGSGRPSPGDPSVLTRSYLVEEK